MGGPRAFGREGCHERSEWVVVVVGGGVQGSRGSYQLDLSLLSPCNLMLH